LPFASVRNSAIDDRCGVSGGSSDPVKQAESGAKNNFCAANGAPHRISYKKLVDLQRLSNDLPKKSADRTGAQALGEGRYMSYIAFVKEAHYSNRGNGEAVNCNIPGIGSNDIHIVLVHNLNDDNCLSTTAEMSPHYRPKNWTPATLNATKGRPVRFRGQLFFDGSHTPCHDAVRTSPPRASVWEIHPVYSVDVCGQTTMTDCEGQSATWSPLH
jgi:hypothetical protein